MTRKNNGCEEMIFVNTNKSILSRNRKRNLSSEEIACDENMKNDGSNSLDKDLDVSPEIETIQS